MARYIGAIEPPGVKFPQNRSDSGGAAVVISGAMYMGAALVGLVLAVVGIDLLLAPAKTLKITLFHPYRRDEWPTGVQEEDVVRFDFTGPRPPAPPIVPSWDEITATSARVDTSASEPAAARSSDVTIEETTSDSVVVEPLHAEVHRLPH